MAACLSLFRLRSSKKPQVVRCPPNEQASLALARQQTNNGFGWLWHVPSSFRVYGHKSMLVQYYTITQGIAGRESFTWKPGFLLFKQMFQRCEGGLIGLFFYQPEALADFLEQHEVDTSWLGLKTWRKPCSSRMWRRQYRRAQRLANLQAV